jgi:hypothetical protein
VGRQSGAATRTGRLHPERRRCSGIASSPSRRHVAGAKPPASVTLLIGTHRCSL